MWYLLKPKIHKSHEFEYLKPCDKFIFTHTHTQIGITMYCVEISD